MMGRLMHRTTCRICGNDKLTKVFDLGSQYLQGSFVKEGYDTPPVRKVPLELVWCDTTKKEHACGLLQLSKSVPTDILYKTYWYRSGTNTTMRNHLKFIVDEIVKKVKIRKPAVLDIGCNDGTMLSFYPREYRKVGIDPSNASDDYKGADISFIKDVYPTSKLEKVKFDVITSIACLYDLESPLEFIYEISKSLNTDGLWVFEMSYMPTMLEMNAYDTICNEHLEYYSLNVIEYMLKLVGLKLIDATLTNTNGGSIMGYVVKETSSSYTVNEETINKLRLKEFEMMLDTEKPYKDFESRSRTRRYELCDLIYRLKTQGKTIHLYGASTKGNTTLQFAGLSNEQIDYAADRNPDKWGATTLGTNIPIISEEASRAMKPDYYLVLPWHFKEEFLIREKESIDNGIKFIFPLPDVSIYPEE